MFVHVTDILLYLQSISLHLGFMYEYQSFTKYVHCTTTSPNPGHLCDALAHCQVFHLGGDLIFSGRGVRIKEKMYIFSI